MRSGLTNDYFTMMPNFAASVDARIPRLLASGCQRRRATEQQRSAQRKDECQKK
jgi:hypothetical protein